MKDLTALPNAFDFTQYQPGDVFCLSRDEINRRGGITSMFMILSALAQAAGKAGLLIEPQVTEDEVRVIFT